jgi:hypothetical protein
MSTASIVVCAVSSQLSSQLRGAAWRRSEHPEAQAPSTEGQTDPTGPDRSP